MERGNILVLYTEFMPYNFAAFETLAKDAKVTVHVVFWDHKKLTPYLPPSSENLKFIAYSTVDRNSIINLVKAIRPLFVFVSGWVDKTYLAVAYHCRKRGIEVVVGFDTKWIGNFRQIVLLTAAHFFVRRFFSRAFVPGNSQYHFARKLGFKDNEIRTGAYTADVDCFRTGSQTYSSKSILFIGRLSRIKGIDMLIRCFLNVKNEKDFADWSLIIVGKGDLQQQLPQHASIIYKDFLPQKEIAELTKDVAFFCLPSIAEPWGLVVHEMAAAGLPLLLSDMCGSAEDFLINQYNGRLFKAGDEEDLLCKLRIMMATSNSERQIMGERSAILSQRNSPGIWSSKLMSLINE